MLKHYIKNGTDIASGSLITLEFWQHCIVG